jgi:26S proteasome regulatory subunit N9
MSFQDPSAEAEQKLSSLSSQYPDQSEFYSTVTAFLQSKLYHQLTVAVLEFTSTSANSHYSSDPASNNFLTLYQILSKLKSKLNPLMLARIATNVSQVQNHESKEGVSILSDLLATDEIKAAPHAKLFAEAKLHLLQMTHDDIESSKDTNDTKSKHEEQVKKFLTQNVITLKELANSTESEVAAVHSAYYETAKELYKKIGPAEEFYKSAIQYLHYTPIEKEHANDPEVKLLARDLSLAALVGKGVYNLGTVVYENSSLLHALEGTEDAYLVELMKSAAEGDVLAVKNLESHRTQLEAQGCDIKVIQEKIMLLALVNMVFERASDERNMKFEDIASRLEVDSLQVEWIVMKALSLGLIKGSMDQVEGFVEITWVMPRVLDNGMMKALAERFGEWSAKVGESRAYMTEHIPAF